MTATRLGIKNVASDEVVANLKLICLEVLEPLRTNYKLPVKINSGYRCEALNKAVNGAKNSKHLTGHAVDVEIVGVSNSDLAHWIHDNTKATKTIMEFCDPDEPSAGWIHTELIVGQTERKLIVIG